MLLPAVAFFRLNNTAMDEGQTPRCTIHVLRRLRGECPCKEVIKLDLFLGNGNAWYAVLIGVGLPVPVVIGVLNPVVRFLHSHAGGPPTHVPVLVPGTCSPSLGSMVVLLLPLVLPSSLGWCSVPSVRLLLLRVARFLRQPGRLVSTSPCTWLQGPSSWCWCWFSAAWSPSVIPPRDKEQTLGSAPPLLPVNLVPPSALPRLLR